MHITPENVIYSIASFVGGIALTSLITFSKNRVRILYYQVAHEKWGLSINDQVHGDVKVIWKGTELKNLFFSTVTITNRATIDIDNFKIKVFTGDDTVLLTQHVQIENTSYVPDLTEEYKKKIEVVDGGQPSMQQIYNFGHEREFHIRHLNRGMTFSAKFLTTVPGESPGPSVWADTLHSGIKLEYSTNKFNIFGVPAREASICGFVSCIFVVVAFWIFPIDSRYSSAVSMIVGLCSLIIGTYIYKVINGTLRIVFG